MKRLMIEAAIFGVLLWTVFFGNGVARAAASAAGATLNGSVAFECKLDSDWRPTTCLITFDWGE